MQNKTNKTKTISNNEILDTLASSSQKLSLGINSRILTSGFTSFIILYVWESIDHLCSLSDNLLPEDMADVTLGPSSGLWCITFNYK